MDTHAEEHLRAVLDAAFCNDGTYQLHQVEPTLQQCIFPIVTWEDDVLRWWGVAFAVAQYGNYSVMVTARHVIRDYREKYLYDKDKVVGQYVLLEPSSPDTSHQYPIEEPWAGDILPILGGSYQQPSYERDRAQAFDMPPRGSAPYDLAVFAVNWEGQNRLLPPTLKLSLQDLDVGERYAAIGYHSVLLEGEVSVPLCEQTEMVYERSLVTSTGVVREVFEHGRDLSGLNFPVFELVADYRPGLSGSPIFDSDGYVRAVVSRGLGADHTDGGPTISYACRIAPLMDLYFGDGDETLGILELAADGDIHVREVQGD